METRCAIPACHVPGTGLPNYLVFSVVQDLAPKIKLRTGEIRDMPADGSTLSEEDINLIACWVDSGALDN